MQTRRLGNTHMQIAPIVFGGNVLGWTADEATSFRVLDAFVDHGFNAIDTADVYSRWAPGHQGGESETVLGRWLKARPGMRERVTIFTKVGSDMGQGKRDLSSGWILRAVEDSLTRLGIEEIDLYFSHWPDPTAEHADTLGAYDRLLKAGKIRAIGASNYDAALLQSALDVAEAEGLPAYQVIQPGYNLHDRAAFEGPLRDLCLERNIGVVCYYGLAAGFLSGKYRNEADLGGRARGESVRRYMTPKGLAILSALDRVAEEQGASQAEVALAWLIQREGVTAPIASATSVEQVESFARAASLTLSAEALSLLETAGT